MAKIFDFFFRLQTELNKKTWELVIIGAGPIGLTAAKIASEKGMEVLVLEKQEKGKLTARAETVESNETRYKIKDEDKKESFSIINKIWGKKFLEEIALDSHNKNKFYPPLPKSIDEHNDVDILENPVNFKWEDFINKMTDILDKKNNIRFEYNTTVKKLSKKDNNNPLVKIKTSRGEIWGKTFFDCAGHNSPFASSFNIDYSHLNNPVIRTKFEKFPDDLTETFHTFFIASGTLTSFPDTPPAMLVIFPCRDEEHKYAEINCQFFTEYGKDGYIYSRKGYKNSFLLKYWKKIKSDYPVFLNMINNSVLKEEYLTYIPCQKMLPKAVYKPGLVKIGDSAGFVRPNSSSSIVTGMKAAEYWAKKIAGIKNLQWDAGLAQELNSDFKKQDFYIYLKDLHRKTRFRKNLAYDSLRSAENIRTFWDVITDRYSWLEKDDAMKISDKVFESKPMGVKVSAINAILRCKTITPNMKQKLINFLEISKKSKEDEEWDSIFQDILINTLFKIKFSIKDLEKIYNIIGPLSPVLHSIAAQNKLIIINKIDSSFFSALSPVYKSELINVLLGNPPLGNRGERKVLDFFNAVINNHEDADNLQKLINNIDGGAKIVLKRFHGREKIMLMQLLNNNGINFN